MAIPGRPGREAVDRPVRRPRRDHHLRRGAIDSNRSQPASVVGGAGHSATARKRSEPRFADGLQSDGARLVTGPIDADVEPADGQGGASRSGHSTRVTPVTWRSSKRPPAKASVASARR